MPTRAVTDTRIDIAALSVLSSHFCGDRVVFKKRGWARNLRGYWEVDHVIQKAKGGSKSAENCLAACTRCNRLRWHRSGAQVRELLVLGLVARDEIQRGTELGRQLRIRRHARTKKSVSRRVGHGAT